MKEFLAPPVRSLFIKAGGACVDPVGLRQMEHYVNIKSISEILGVSPKTIYHWTHCGSIPHYRLPKGIRFRVSEIESWMQRRRRKLRETVIVI